VWLRRSERAGGVTVKLTIKQMAQERCDKARRKSPLAHVLWSVGDPPCRDCVAWAREKKRKLDEIDRSVVKHRSLEQRLLAILRTKRLRTSELLAEAGVKNRHLGEDTIWLLVQRGEIKIGPDSKLRLAN